MILAAGRGERLKPLTDTLPKALLPVHGRALIEWQVMRLAAGGIKDLVINCAWLGEMIENRLGDGADLGVRISYSREPEALETLGGIVQALPLLGCEAFAVVSADVYTDFNYADLERFAQALDRPGASVDAHFVMVENPSWHEAGDMALESDGIISLGVPRLTYGNIALYHPRLFAQVPTQTKLKLFPWAFQFVRSGRISGSLYRGVWHNVGTIDDLNAVNASSSQR